MKIKNSLTPYPILCDYNDDYRDSKFDAEIHLTNSLDKVKCEVVFRLKNDVLEKMIQEHKAVYLLHIESPQSSYRTEVTTANDKVSLVMRKDELADSIEICTFIVAATDIEDYYNPNFNALDADLHIALTKGSILAVGTQKEILIERKKQDARDADSLIHVEKSKAGKPASVYINTENDDYLMLGIDEKLYDTYFGLGKGKYRETVFSLLFMPALVVVLSRMCHVSQSGENYFEEKKWYQAIVDLLERAGYTLDSLSEDNETLLEAVQVIFKNPISRALNELSTNNDVEE